MGCLQKIIIIVTHSFKYNFFFKLRSINLKKIMTSSDENEDQLDENVEIDKKEKSFVIETETNKDADSEAKSSQKDLLPTPKGSESKKKILKKVMRKNILYEEDESEDEDEWIYCEEEMVEEEVDYEEVSKTLSVKSGLIKESEEKITFGGVSYYSSAIERDRQWFTRTLSNNTQLTSGLIQDPFLTKNKEGPQKKESIFKQCFGEEEIYPNLRTEFSIVFGTQPEITKEEEVEIPWQDIYILPHEVLLHNTERDCWVSWHGVVRNLTPLTASDPEAAVVILAEAGKDISHWFTSTGHLKQCTEVETWLRKYYLPRGDIPGQDEPLPWWRDQRFNVGTLSFNPRTIHITNTLTSQTVTIEVAGEEKVSGIMARYLPFNSNASSYTWSYEGKELDMNKTLSENGIPDDSDRYAKAGVPALTYIPTIMLKYNDFIA